MPRPLIAFAVVLGLAAPVFAELKFKEIRVRHGQHGPDRVSLDVIPGDEVVISYTMTGVQSDAGGIIDCELRQQVSDGDGKVLIDNKTPIKEILTFAGGSLPGFASTTIGPKTPPGKYTITVTVTDKLREESAMFARTVTVTKPDFGIVRPRLAHDAEGKIPAGLTNVLGTRLFFRLIAVGLDKTQKKLDLTMTVQHYDDRGRELMPKPLTVTTKSEDEDKVAAADSITFNGSFACNRVGAFKVKIVVTDNVSKKSATFEAPLKVVE